MTPKEANKIRNIIDNILSDYDTKLSQNEFVYRFNMLKERGVKYGTGNYWCVKKADSGNWNDD